MSCKCTAHQQLSTQNPLYPVARADKQQRPVEDSKSRTSGSTDLQKKDRREDTGSAEKWSFLEGAGLDSPESGALVDCC